MTVDTLTIYEQLKSSSLNDEAARGIAEVLRNVVENDLATKLDIEIIRKEIETAKADIIKWVAGMLVAQAAVFAALVKLL